MLLVTWLWSWQWTLVWKLHFRHTVLPQKRQNTTKFFQKLFQVCISSFILILLPSYGLKQYNLYCVKVYRIYNSGEKTKVLGIRTLSVHIPSTLIHQLPAWSRNCSAEIPQISPLCPRTAWWPTELPPAFTTRQLVNSTSPSGNCGWCPKFPQAAPAVHRPTDRSCLYA